MSDKYFELCKEYRELRRKDVWDLQTMQRMREIDVELKKAESAMGRFTGRSTNYKKDQIGSLIDTKTAKDIMSVWKMKVRSLEGTWIEKHPLILELILWYYEKKYLSKILKCVK